MRRESSITAALAACVIAGAAIASALLPWIVRHSPTELTRTSVLLSALRGADSVPDVLVLGNSVVMNGVDARALGRRAWNLGTTAQALDESLLWIDAAPKKPTTFVIGVSRDALLGESQSIDATRYAWYVLGGYRPTPAVANAARRASDSALALRLGTSRWRAVVASRWVVRATLDLRIRERARRDIDFVRGERDLYFPSPYAAPVIQSALRVLLARATPRPATFGPSESASQTLLAARDLARAHGGRIVLLILPEHPALTSETTPAFEAGFREWADWLRAREHLLVIDAHALLGAAEFIDDKHPTRAGAARLSAVIADSLGLAANGAF